MRGALGCRRPVEALAEPISGAAGRVVLDLTYEVLSGARVEVRRLEAMGEEDDLVATASRRLVFCGREQGTSEAATSHLVDLTPSG
jgi:hypothetical protein